MTTVEVLRVFATVLWFVVVSAVALAAILLPFVQWARRHRRDDSSYAVVYMLKPVREVEPGWWKLRWRLIWGQTVYIYREPTYGPWWAHLGLGFRSDWSHDGHNGWGRSFHRIDIQFWAGPLRFRFWTRWRFVVHQDGPLDMTPRRPLVLPIPVVINRSQFNFGAA